MGWVEEEKAVGMGGWMLKRLEWVGGWVGGWEEDLRLRHSGSRGKQST